jgi:ribosomal-protein-alanine N-acetyltransferase
MISGWLDQHSGSGDVLCACLDGARGDVFYVLYDVAKAPNLESATLLIEPSVATPGEAAARVRTMIGGRSCTLVGDGVERYADQFRAAMPNASIDSPMPNLAEAAVRLAWRQHRTGVAPHALRPIYIRRPDAEMARDRAAATLDFTIVPITDAAGLAEVAALQARAFADAWSADDVAGGEANRSISRVHAARHRSGQLIGYSVVWHVLDELHIQSVAVDPGFRRKGVAKTLLQHVLEEARAAGVSSATLEVRASNTAARDLYGKFGFQTEAVRKTYYQNPVEDALILWRRNL